MALVTRGENYTLSVFKLKPNSSYEYEDMPSFCFKGRPARTMERNFYTIQSGVTNGVDEVFIFASNVPKELKVGDKVLYLAKYWTISSIGVYLEESRLVNADIMNPQKLMERAPKGFTLK